MSKVNFKLHVQSGLLTNQTNFTRNGVSYKIDTPKELCQLMYRIWKKETRSTSFDEWAQSLNESGDYEGHFTREDAIDNFGGFAVLNINNKHVRILDFVGEHWPEILA